MVDDLQLIESAVAGDREAFGDLVNRYQPRLYNAMVHTIGSAEEAEDVVQEAFVKAFTNLSQFEKKSLFYTWLYRIALNVRSSRGRRKRPQAIGDKANELAAQQPDPTPEASEQAIAAERTARLRMALAELNEPAREILVLREIEERNYEEIAEILEIRVGTVRSRLHRARSQLQAVLEAGYSEL